MANAHRGRLNDLDIPAAAKDPSTWSELAQREGANAVAAAASSESSGFNASIVDGWGGGRANVWGERGDTERLLRSHPEAARYLATELLKAGFDTVYAWSEGGKRGRRVAASIGIYVGAHR